MTFTVVVSTLVRVTVTTPSSPPDVWVDSAVGAAAVVLTTVDVASAHRVDAASHPDRLASPLNGAAAHLSCGKPRATVLVASKARNEDVRNMLMIVNAQDVAGRLTKVMSECKGKKRHTKPQRKKRE